MSNSDVTEQRYRLQFLFSGETAELERDIRRSLDKHLRNVELLVEDSRNAAVRVSLTGSRAGIDACHDKLNKSNHDFARVVDELGQELRREAYPILANVEEKLRAFINEALIPSFGLSWWEQIGVERIRTRVADVEAKNRGRGIPHHPIEYADFEHLVVLITADLAGWKKDEHLSLQQLAELLEGCSTVDDVRTALANRTEKKSFWGSVFVHLFENEAQWKAAEEDLVKMIIPLRNKVMHHRPMRLFELEQLHEASARVIQALDATRRTMQPEETEEVRRNAVEIFESLARQRAQILEWMRPTLELQQDVSASFTSTPIMSQLEHMRNMMPLIESVANTRRTIEELGGVRQYLRMERKSDLWGEQVRPDPADDAESDGPPDISINGESSDA